MPPKQYGCGKKGVDEDGKQVEDRNRCGRWNETASTNNVHQRPRAIFYIRQVVPTRQPCLNSEQRQAAGRGLLPIGPKVKPFAPPATPPPNDPCRIDPVLGSTPYRPYVF